MHSRAILAALALSFGLACSDGGADTTNGDTVPSTGPYRQVTSGMRHACAIRQDGTVQCWGYNGVGQATAPAGTFKQISAGILHSCGVRTDGSLTCWGGFDSCSRSTGSVVASFNKIATGGEIACGLTGTNEVLCWGCDPQAAPASLQGDAIDVGTDGVYMCALNRAGKVSCWGQRPMQNVPSLPGADAISIFGEYGCLHASDDSFVCWEGTYASASEPGTASVVSSPAGKFTKVRAGSGHYCGIRADATVECWGFNPDGRATAPEGKFLDVAPGGFHTCGLKTDGTIVCWGDATEGGRSPTP